MLKLMQLIMVTVNVVFFICGGTMLGISIWLAVDDQALSNFDNINANMNNDLYAASVYMMIGVGSAVTLLGFLGCWGAANSDGSGGACMLKLYFILVKLIVIAEIIIIILAAVFWGSINDNVANAMQTDVKVNYYNDTSYTTAWNNMQQTWSCCGSYNYADYQGSYYTAMTGNIVPQSCCRQTGGDNSVAIDYTQCILEAGQSPSAPGSTYTQLFTKGCYTALQEFVDQNAAIIIGIVCGFMGVQIIGMIFACCLLKNRHD